MSATKQKAVMMFGSFDGIHPGHLSAFVQARLLGSHLTIVLARDQTIQRIKQHAPRNPELKRAKAVKALKIADRVVLGSLTDIYAVIRKYKPDIIALGYDQYAFTEKLTEKFPKIKLVRLQPFFPEKYKSSLLAKKK